MVVTAVMVVVGVAATVVDSRPAVATHRRGPAIVRPFIARRFTTHLATGPRATRRLASPVGKQSDRAQ